jgi:hypothetical protein
MSGTAARVASGHEDFWQAFRSEQAASLAELDNLERNGESPSSGRDSRAQQPRGATWAQMGLPVVDEHVNPSELIGSPAWEAAFKRHFNVVAKPLPSAEALAAVMAGGGAFARRLREVAVAAGEEHVEFGEVLGKDLASFTDRDHLVVDSFYQEASCSEKAFTKDWWESNAGGLQLVEEAFGVADGGPNYFASVAVADLEKAREKAPREGALAELIGVLRADWEASRAEEEALGTATDAGRPDNAVGTMTMVTPGGSFGMTPAVPPAGYPST